MKDMYQESTLGDVVAALDMRHHAILPYTVKKSPYEENNYVR